MNRQIAAGQWVPETKYQQDRLEKDIFNNQKNDLQFSPLKNRVPAQAGAGKTLYTFARHMMYFQYVIARMCGKLCKKRKLWISEAKFFLDGCNFEESLLAQFLSHTGDFLHGASLDTHLTKCQSAYMWLKIFCTQCFNEKCCFLHIFLQGPGNHSNEVS